VPSVTGSPDVDLIEADEQRLSSLCAGTPVTAEDTGFWQFTRFEDGAARLCWKEHFEFVVSADGHRVLWCRLADVPDEVLTTYLLGQVLSFCLLSRGIEPLHATCVAVDGQGVAFLGDSGHGKSTIAGALLGRGYPLVSDDVLIIEFRGNAAYAHPSVPRIKLMPQSADAVFQGRRAIPMNSFTPKMIFPLQASQCVSQMVPLRAAYVLAGNSHESIRIRRVRGAASLLELVRNSFNVAVLTPSRLKQQFIFANRLLGAVGVKQLSYPKQLDRLPEVIDAVLADVGHGVKPR
jgi:hypothetical protein